MYSLTQLHYCFRYSVTPRYYYYILEVLQLPLLHTTLKKTLSTHYYSYPLLLRLHYCCYYY